MTTSTICVTICILMILFLLFVFIYTNCVSQENFTAPGLTLTPTASWFPQMAAKAYKKEDWEVKMYLDRYPFWDADREEYISDKLSNKLASTNRFWKI
jgi:hypothetical protein